MIALVGSQNATTKMAGRESIRSGAPFMSGKDLKLALVQRPGKSRCPVANRGTRAGPTDQACDGVLLAKLGTALYVIAIGSFWLSHAI
jgi:hypothetical protein